MTGFQLTSDHDLMIMNGDFVFLQGAGLLVQTVECVIGTNKGEWFLDEMEGITFSSILGKHPDPDIVKSEINNALQQVDSSFVLGKFECVVEQRRLKIHFVASNDTGQLPIDIEF